MTSPDPRLQVLLVEDTGSDALLVRQSLERSGAPVDLTVVPRAEDALERLDAVAVGKAAGPGAGVDVLVSDHRLPGLSGLELCREVIGRGYDVATVLLTGVGSEDLAVEALKAGVDEYLIKDTSGGYLALFATVLIEVDRRRRAAIEHRRAEQRLRHLAAIVESSDAAILGCDLQQTIVSWNPAATRLFGWEASAAIGQTAAILLPIDHGDEMPRILARVRAGEQIDHYETVRRRRDGSILEVALTVSPIRDADGHVVGSSAIFRDLTAQRRAEASRRRSDRELETFLLGVTRALRPSMHSARGMFDLVRGEWPVDESAVSADFQRYLSRLDTSLDDMAQLLDELAELAGVGRGELARSRVPTRSVALAVAERLDAAATHRNVEIEVDPDSSWPSVWADAERLQRLLSCLVDNAVRFASRRVRMRANADRTMPHQVVIQVADDGPGIPRGEQARLFDPFYSRGPAANGGAGLGLTLVRRLVESLGGRIDVESEVGRGAVFSVALPAAARSAGAVEAAVVRLA